MTGKKIDNITSLKSKLEEVCCAFLEIANGVAAAAAAKLLQSCLTLCDPIDGSPPGSPFPGIFQARVLEWGAIALSTLDFIS